MYDVCVGLHIIMHMYKYNVEIVALGQVCGLARYVV